MVRPADNVIWQRAPPPNALLEHCTGVLHRIARPSGTAGEVFRTLPLVACAAFECHVRQLLRRPGCRFLLCLRPFGLNLFSRLEPCCQRVQEPGAGLVSLTEEHWRKGLCNYDVIGPSRPTDGDVARGDHGSTGRSPHVEEVDDGLVHCRARDAVRRGSEVRNQSEPGPLHHCPETGATIPGHLPFLDHEDIAVLMRSIGDCSRQC